MELTAFPYTVTWWTRRRKPGKPGKPRGLIRRRTEPTEAAAGPRGTWDDPRIPWAGRPRRVDILCWAGIVLSGIYYWALLPFVAPLVGTHPVLLEVLNGNTAAIISAAAFVRVGHGTLAVVLLAAIPGLMKFDVLYWWAGRLWGERIIALLSGRRNRGGRYMARVQRWGRKFTWPAVVVAQFLPIPTAIIYVVVGWAGMRLVTFLILDAIGTLLWAGLLAGLGYELGHRAVVVAQSHLALRAVDLDRADRRHRVLPGPLAAPPAAHGQAGQPRRHRRPGQPRRHRRPGQHGRAGRPRRR